MGSYRESPSGHNGWRFPDAVAGDAGDRRDEIAGRLRRLFDDVVTEPIPPAFLGLLDEAEDVSGAPAQTDPVDWVQGDVD